MCLNAVHKVTALVNNGPVFCLPKINRQPQRKQCVTLTCSGDNFTPTRKTGSKCVCAWTPFGNFIGIRHLSLLEWTRSGQNLFQCFLIWLSLYSNYLCPCKHNYITIVKASLSMCAVLSTKTLPMQWYCRLETRIRCSDLFEHTFYRVGTNGWNLSNPVAVQGQSVRRLTLNNTISPHRFGTLPCLCLIPALCVITHPSNDHSLTSHLISSSLRRNNRFKDSAWIRPVTSEPKSLKGQQHT